MHIKIQNHTLKDSMSTSDLEGVELTERYSATLQSIKELTADLDRSEEDTTLADKYASSLSEIKQLTEAAAKN